MIKLVILDIDGVMTDGTKAYDGNHDVVFKKYCDRDFTAIKRLKTAGMNVCFLSGDRAINEKMAEKRHVDFHYSRDKETTLNSLLQIYNCSIDEVAYIGDDIYDIPVLRQVKYAFCPSNAPNDVKDCCTQILSSKSGDSVVSEFYDMLVRNELVRRVKATEI